MNRISALILICGMLAFRSIVPCAQASDNMDFQKHIASSGHTFEIARKGLQRAVDFTRSRPDLFKRQNSQKNELMTRSQKLTIWNTWSSTLYCLAALDNIKNQWKGFHSFKDEHRRNAAFALHLASFLAGYRYALEFIDLADKNPSLNTILDEAVPELGIPDGTFSRFKFRFLNVAIATEFSALQVIAKTYATDKVPAQLARFIEDDVTFIWKMGKGKGPVLTMKNALAVVRKAAFQAWFPVQKHVSEWIGDTKVYRKGVHLISNDQIEWLRERLLPGDLLFERHEWYLSNMGLPGFWTHTAMYVGTPEQRRTFFSDPETAAWVKNQGISDGDFEMLLKQRYSEAYVMAMTPGEDGHAPCIVEAISEGVSFTSLEYSGASDSLGVLRPRLSKTEKASAILRAFHYSGRPYDFNFDFETDASLVCSELVYKAYEPAPGMKGINFPISEVMGRKVSTPNAMVRQFDEHFRAEDAQTDFVLFLDGIEDEKRAVISSLDEFRGSWRRPNWHILIQKAPE